MTAAATPDNFLNVVQDALIKNFHEATLRPSWRSPSISSLPRTPRAPPFGCAPGSSSTTAAPVTPDDVKWSYEHYHGAWAEVLHDKTERVEIVDDRTVRFHFNEPFLDFPTLIGPPMSAAPAGSSRRNITRRSARTASRRSRSAPGPTSSSRRSRERGSNSRPSRTITAPVHVKKFTISACPTRPRGSRCSSAAKPTSFTASRANWSTRVKSNPKLMLAPVVSGNFWLEFPGFQDPKSPFHDKRVREAISLAIDRDAINQAECAGLGQGRRQLDQ